MSEELFDVRLTVNGAAQRASVPARRLLSDFLRHDLGLTGTHVGCEHGVCGACTVLLDGRPVRSCLLLAVTADGSDVTTVEGLAEPDGTLSPVQQAFQDCHGLQCGYCTPGFLTTITAGLRETPQPTRNEAREMIAGNLCRCTGYLNIVVGRAPRGGAESAMSTRLFGQPIARREDPRFLRGEGAYLDDLGQDALAAAFVRSPHAHARIATSTCRPRWTSRSWSRSTPTTTSPGRWPNRCRC